MFAGLLMMGGIVLGSLPVAETFEGNLLSGQSPPGGWDYASAQSNVTVGLESVEPLHRGRHLRVVDDHTSAADIAEAQVGRQLTLGSGSLFVRHWVRLASVAGAGTTVFNGVSCNWPGSPISVGIDHQTQHFTLQGFSNGGATHHFDTATSPPATVGEWHLVEMGLEGIGTESAIRRLWVDGVHAAQSTGLSMTGLIIEELSVGLTWQSPGSARVTLDLDDYRAQATPNATRLAIVGLPPEIVAGICQPLGVFLQDVLGQASPAPYPFEAELRANGSLVAVYQDAGCTLPGGLGFSALSSSATGFVKLTAEGEATVRAHYPDFLSSAVSTLVSSAAPRAVLVAAPTEGAAPLAVTFDASASTARAEVLPLSFLWQFDDGSPGAAGAVATHTYAVPGHYRPTVAVQDSGGVAGQAEGEISVLDSTGQRPPRVRIIASATFGIGILPLQLTSQVEAGSAPIAAYRWELGEGELAAGPAAAKTFGPGRHRVYLRVVDAAGILSSASVEILVTRADGRLPPLCRAEASPAAGFAPLEVTYRASHASPEGAPLTHRWMFADGALSKEAVVTLDYQRAGRDAARLVVEDDTGLGCEDVAEVAVLSSAGIPPRIVSVPSRFARCGQAYRYGDGPPAAAGSTPFSWSLETAGPQLDPATGSIRWTPTAAERGPRDLVLRVENAAGFDRQRIPVEVECTAGPPTEEERPGCGCASLGAGFAPPVLLGLALFALRRRRGKRSPPSPG